VLFRSRNAGYAVPITVGNMMGLANVLIYRRSPRKAASAET